MILVTIYQIHPTSDVAAVNVSVMNGHIKTFETTLVERIIESLDGKSRLRITTERVIGNMKVIDWSMCVQESGLIYNVWSFTS